MHQAFLGLKLCFLKPHFAIGALVVSVVVSVVGFAPSDTSSNPVDCFCEEIENKLKSQLVDWLQNYQFASDELMMPQNSATIFVLWELLQDNAK